MALFLSFMFPGLGQGYNGQVAKALVFCMSFVGSIWALTQSDPLPFAVFLPFIYFYGLVDAYRSAEFLNARGRMATYEEETTESVGWGATLVVLGLVFLAHNFGWLSFAWLHRFWPVILIVAGVLFMRKSLQSRGPGVRAD
jgi:hypothetical protein